MRVVLSFVLLLCLTLPIQAGPFPFLDQVESPWQLEMDPADLVTNWGYTNENSYNGAIIEAVQQEWDNTEYPLSPLMFKALIAVESAFRYDAVSRTGAAGLTQLTPDTARRFGLSLHQRMEPVLALRAGVNALEEKHAVIVNPGNYYGIVLGQPDKRAPWADKVAAAYSAMGRPEAEDAWWIGLAAYNGGGQTMLRAMARASERGLDPRRWENLVNHNNPKASPLYAACVDIYRYGAASKYREMSEYPAKIFALYREAGGR